MILFNLIPRRHSTRHRFRPLAISHAFVRAATVQISFCFVLRRMVVWLLQMVRGQEEMRDSRLVYRQPGHWCRLSWMNESHSRQKW